MMRSIVENNHIFTVKFSYLLLNCRAWKFTETFLLFEKYKMYILKTNQTYEKRRIKASDKISDVNIVNVNILNGVILHQYQMKTSVVWITGIYQVDYLWVKSQANECLRGVWKLSTFNFIFSILFCLYHLKRSEKRSWKGHGKVIEFHSWISVWTMISHAEILP